MPNDRRARLFEEDDSPSFELEKANKLRRNKILGTAVSSEEASWLLEPQGFDVTPKNDNQDLFDSIELDRYKEEMRQIREEEKANRTPQVSSQFKYKDLQARPMTPDELEQYESDPDNVYNSVIRKRKR